MTEGPKKGSPTEGTAEPPAADGSAKGPRPNVGWGKILALLAWGFVVLAFAAGGLADATNLWWLVLVFGAAAPVVFVALQNRASFTGEKHAADRAGEREILEALREHGELTPASAAMLTTLTVGGASGVLESLAREGHLESRAGGGSIVYTLRERDRRTLGGSKTGVGAGDPGPQPLPEPLSGRELEVLRLMALGRTNAQISRELFVAVGTVKAHANNIYRKLGAANRAEAVSTARTLKLLT